MSSSDSDHRIEEILEQLDRAYLDFNYPGPPNLNYPTAGVRASGFSNGGKWLLIFQVLCFGHPTSAFEEVVHAFGSDIADPGLQNTRDVMTAPDGAFWGDERFLPDIHNFTALTNGRLETYRYTPHEYASSGIDLQHTDREVALLRMIARDHLSELLSSVDSVAPRADMPSLPKMFELNEWRQPDSLKGERVGDMECFRLMAKSLATGQILAPDSCVRDANTHWSNWLDAE
ncbi:DUF7003 family protein [Streptomyces sp. BE230]|uniref:DUF7003 family protein n=1 Tax=Streptomyces sp. BE230 TaxID=3002526 RepID=UPI002ED077F0|nr:hypothetical protein [Streptomyces sp. BE230]